MASVSFIDKLLVRLKSGDARSIHLNALPGNFARLDIYDLVNIDQSLHLKFLNNLLTKNAFRFSITADPALLNGKSSDEKKIIQKIIKRLNHLDYQEKEEFSEHGYTSFGFGYPLLIKRDPANAERILKAPLLIWYLTIEKDSRKNNTWIISREEEQPLIFNELLRSHFESNERIKTDDLEELLEENFLNEQQLNHFCQKVLEKFNVPFNGAENIITLLPGTNKESIEQLTKEHPWIRWSGIFGLYKMQKQSIIKDAELLIARQQENNLMPDHNDSILFEGEVLSPIQLDPSQENVLHQLRQQNNIIIQGPPGTGKSQSLTAIITQALLNKQKVLVVCEKRTAMEVLYKNLKEQQLHHLSVLIEDVYSDRKHIVEQVRERVEDMEQATIRHRTNEYELIRSRFLSLQEEINHRINFTGTEIFGDDNWLELLSKSYDINQNAAVLEQANSLNKHIRNSDYTFTYEEYIALSGKIKTAIDLFLKVDKEAFVFDNTPDTFFTDNLQEGQLTEHINKLQKQSTALYLMIQTNLKELGENYDAQKGFTAFKVSLLSLFSNRYKQVITEKENTKIECAAIQNLLTGNHIIPADLSLNELEIRISDILPKLEKIRTGISVYYLQLGNLPAYFHYRKFLLQQDAGTQALIAALAKTGSADWPSVFTTYYLNQTILKTALENGIKDDTLQLYRELAETDILLKQKLSEKIRFVWQQTIQDSIRTKDLSKIKYLYNQRKNKQFSSKNSLRKIIHQDFDFFTTLFPVLMVNPTVATSILPLQENLFDFIILDEASQLRLEDTYSSLLRGRTKIVSGDKHQMPPSNFFGNEVIFWNDAEEEENKAEDFLAESKSLLEYTNDADYKNTYLDYHYRSRHPDLIQFSNHAFYQSRLIPMPEKTPYQSIHYRQTDGIYTDGTNKKEAAEIVRFIYQTEKINGEYPGIGIATFNLHQRNLIFDELYEQAYADQSKSELLQALLSKGLFVKNLENIQGDERDIMILSTTFGKDEAGKFRQSFGPLTQEKGYQLLNVIITRARHSLYVFSSIPEQIFQNFEEELALKGNTGKSIFYAYLAYVKACSENNTEQITHIKNCLQKNSSARTSGHTQPFPSGMKQQVATALKTIPEADIRQNYRLGGFVLDIVLFKDNRPFLLIDFENTRQYHPDVTYRIKLHQDQLTEGFGIKTYHLWSYNWWKNAAYEIGQIQHILSQQ